MQALFYLKYRSFINSIKQLKEKPGKLISVIFYLGIFFWVLIPQKGQEVGHEIDINGLNHAPQLILSAGFLILTAIITTASLHSGTKTGISIFTQPDVHILFTSPVKPATVLLFGMLSQLKAAFLSSIFIFYQIYNLKRLGLDTGQIVLLFIIWFFSVFAMQIYSTFAYAISFDSQKKKNMILILAYGILFLILSVFLAQYLKSGDILKAFFGFLKSKFLYFIPIVGWSKGFLDLLMIGFNPPVLIAAILFWLVPLTLLFLLYKLKMDFYEDALTMAQRQAVGEQERQALVEEAVKKKTGKMKVREQGLNKGSGESAIFFKQWREYRRQKPYVLSWNMFIQLAFLGTWAVFTRQDRMGNIGMSYVLWGVSVGILYFTSFRSPLLDTFNDPQFFILPGKSFLKVFYASLLSIFIRFIDIVPIYLFISIFYQLNPIMPLMAFLLTISLLFAINTAQIITFRIFGEFKSGISAMLLFTITLVSLIPTGILMYFSAAALLASSSLKSLILAVIAIALNLLAGVLGLWVGKGYLNKGPSF